jgi:hypothetical protein
MGGAPLSVTLAVQTIVRMKVKPANWAIVWTHFALGLIIVAEITFIILGMRFIAPGCRRVLTYVDTDVSGFYAFMPGATYLLGLLHSIAYQTGWWLIAFAIAWALFEWRVPREGKQGLRLSALTSLALLQFVAIAMFAVLVALPTAKAADRLNARHPEPMVAERMAALDRLLGGIDEALAKNDLTKADDLAHTAMGAAIVLANTGAAAPTLLTSAEPLKIEAMRRELDLMATSMREAWFAARRRKAEQIQPALKKFREAYAYIKNQTVQSAR